MQCLRTLALTALCLAALMGGAEADQRLSVGDTPVSLMFPDGFELDSDQNAVVSDTAFVAVSAQQLADTSFAPSVSDPSFLQFLSVMRRSGAVPDNAQVEDVRAGRHGFRLLAYEKQLGGRNVHFWQAMTGPEPTVMIQFMQVDMPGAGELLSKEGVLALLATAEFGSPIPFAEMLPETGLIVSPRSPFDHYDVMANAVMMSTYERYVPTVGQVVLTLAYLDHIDPDGDLEDVADRVHPNGAVVEQSHPTKFMGVEGIRRIGQDLSQNGGQFLEYLAVVEGRPVGLVALRAGGNLTPEQLASIDEIAKTVRSAGQDGELQ